MSSPCAPLPEEAPPPEPLRVDGRTVVAAVVLVGLLRAVLPTLPVPRSPLLVNAVSLAYLAVLIPAGAGLSVLAHTRSGRTLLAACLLGGLVLALRLTEVSGPMGGLLYALGDWAVFCGAVLLGTAASAIVREPNLLPPICLTAAAVDYVAIRYGGPTVQALARVPELVEGASTALPAVGAAVGPLPAGTIPTGALAVVGLGDVLFLGLAFGTAGRFGFRLTPSVVWTTIGAAVGMATVLLTDLPLPGLPFIALGCVLPNLGRFRYTRGELVSLAIVAVFLLLFCVGLVALSGGQPPDLPGATP